MAKKKKKPEKKPPPKPEKQPPKSEKQPPKSEPQPPKPEQQHDSSPVQDDVTQIYMQNRATVFLEAYEHVRDVERARDLTTHAFIKFLTARRSIQKPGAWLRKTVKNLSLNAIRDEKRHDEKLHQVQHFLQTSIHDSEKAVSTIVDSSRLHAIAFAPDSPLGIVEQQVLQLIIDELSVAEMARAVGIPESTMRDLKRRVLNSVRDLLLIDTENRKAL